MPGTPPSFGQLIYVYPGLGAGTLLLQPVIQFGPGQNGSFQQGWGAGNFYYIERNTVGTTIPPMVDVQKNDKITGSIVFTGQNNGQYGYTCSLSRNSGESLGTPINITCPSPLTTAFVALESKNIDDASSYPAGNTLMTIETLTDVQGNPLQPTWSKITQPTAAGEGIDTTQTTINLRY